MVTKWVNWTKTNLLMESPMTMSFTLLTIVKGGEAERAVFCLLAPSGPVSPSKRLIDAVNCRVYSPSCPRRQYNDKINRPLTNFNFFSPAENWKPNLFVITVETVLATDRPADTGPAECWTCRILDLQEDTVNN